jgi:cytochrome c-type biogenesis protein CcmE
MRKRSQRLWLIGAASVLALGAVALAATALQDTVAFFYGPTDVVERNLAVEGQSARVGGLVEANSVSHDANGALVFRITDTKHAVPVVYNNIPPDLFSECQGVVAEGKFDTEGRLIANRVLAKHDENYMPAEVYESMKKNAGEASMANCGVQEASVDR